MQIVITRHPEFEKLLIELGYIKKGEYTLITHISDIDQIRGKNVIGILPLNLAAHTKSVLFPTWKIPNSFRGKEWTYEETKKFFRGMHKYKVREVA